MTQKVKLSPAQSKLLQAAKDARKKAYAPYSKFLVGAALQSKDGTIFFGCNVENAAYGDTICAERTAVVKAVSEGKKQFIRIAVIADFPKPCPPCGSCRQVLAEFAPKLEVIMANTKGEVTVSSLDKLLPGMFSLDEVLKKA